jgi:hypothetical protein
LIPTGFGLTTTWSTEVRDPFVRRLRFPSGDAQTHCNQQSGQQTMMEMDRFEHGMPYDKPLIANVISSPTRTIEPSIRMPELLHQGELRLRSAWVDFGNRAGKPCDQLVMEASSPTG